MDRFILSKTAWINLFFQRASSRFSRRSLMGWSRVMLLLSLLCNQSSVFSGLFHF